MTVYVVAQLRVTDRAAYERYRSRFVAVFERHAGRVLASDDRPEVVEGTWDCDRIVLLSFPDAASCRAWYDSAEYQEIARDRIAGAESVILLVQGMEMPRES